MTQQLKRWESPRSEGRNHKGRGGSAKARQYMKRQKQLRKRLKEGINGSGPKSSSVAASGKTTGQTNKKREAHEPPFFLAVSKQSRQRYSIETSLLFANPSVTGHANSPRHLDSSR